MASAILVSKIGEGEYRVDIREDNGQTSHVVSLQDADCRRLTGGKGGAEDLVRKSFEFLLEREPKESILRKFDLPVIGRYFPEYEREIVKRLGG